eukprot:762481-Hanusia_phi.AAC.3
MTRRAIDWRRETERRREERRGEERRGEERRGEERRREERRGEERRGEERRGEGEEGRYIGEDKRWTEDRAQSAEGDLVLHAARREDPHHPRDPVGRGEIEGHLLEGRREESQQLRLSQPDRVEPVEDGAHVLQRELLLPHHLAHRAHLLVQQAVALSRTPVRPHQRQHVLGCQLLRLLPQLAPQLHDTVGAEEDEGVPTRPPLQRLQNHRHPPDPQLAHPRLDHISICPQQLLQPAPLPPLRLPLQLVQELDRVGCSDHARAVGGTAGVRGREARGKRARQIFELVQDNAELAATLETCRQLQTHYLSRPSYPFCLPALARLSWSSASCAVLELIDGSSHHLRRLCVHVGHKQMASSSSRHPQGERACSPALPLPDRLRVRHHRQLVAERLPLARLQLLLHQHVDLHVRGGFALLQHVHDPKAV